MKNLKTFCLFALCFITMGAFAQSAPQPAPKPAASPTPVPTIAAVINAQIGIIEKEFVSAAEAMPEDKFNFAPSSLNLPGSDYKGVRTFAAQVKHVAAVNYLLWSPVLGEKPTIDLNDGDGPASMTSKADIIKFLKDSYALGHRAANSITAENIVALVPNPFGAGQVSKLFCVTFAVAHGFDHYGQSVEYLRMNGIIPPASRGNN
jgi:DinB superfamily